MCGPSLLKCAYNLHIDMNSSTCMLLDAKYLRAWTTSHWGKMERARGGTRLCMLSWGGLSLRPCTSDELATNVWICSGQQSSEISFDNCINGEVIITLFELSLFIIFLNLSGLRKNKNCHFSQPNIHNHHISLTHPFRILHLLQFNWKRTTVEPNWGGIASYESSELM
jgi:hypothetical protein